MKKVLSYVLSAILVVSMFSIVLVAPGHSSVTGQLEVSTNQFWGNALVQVHLYDPDLNLNSSAYDTATVIYTKGSNQTTLTLNESLPNSGEFYAYIRAAGTNTPANPPYGTVYPMHKVIVAKGDTFTLTYNDQSPVGTVSVTVKYAPYEATSSDLFFDRSNLEYPMNGYIRLEVKDLDWNLDPTDKDSIPLNFSLYNPVSGKTAWVNTTATETSENSAIFRIETSYYTDNNFAGYAKNLTAIGLTSGSVVKVTYTNETTPPYKYIKFKTFSVSLNVASTFTTAGDLTITVVDPNMNHKSWDAEALGSFGGTNVTVTFGSDTVTLTSALNETGADSGTFTATVPVVIGNVASDSKLQVVVPLPSGKSASIKYYSNGTLKAETSSTLSTTSATIDSDKTMYKADATVQLTLTAPDLNYESSDINFVQCNIPSTGLIDSLNIPVDSQNVGKFTIKVNGLVANSSGAQTLVFLETDVNTGVFTASLDLSKIRNHVGGALTNGDSVQVIYADQINGVSASVTFTIGVAAASISLDRSTYPVPKEGTITIYINVTDSEANTNPSTIERPTAYLDVYFYNGTLQSSNAVTLTETGPDTGIFTGSFSLGKSSVAAYINGWVKALYVDPSTGKNITAIATLLATDASISVDVATVKAGDEFTVIVNDQDSNFDSESVEYVNVNCEYTNTGGTTVKSVLRLTETDVNTGVFNLSRTVGLNIMAKPGTTITLTYNDTTPSYITASSGYPSTPVKYTATVKVASFTGTLTTDKTEYGIGSEMIVTVNDLDLNTDITRAEQVTVTLRVSGMADQTLTLDEKNASSSEFTYKYTWPTSSSYIGKTFQIYYKDEADASGSTKYAIITGTIKSWDGVVEFEKANYNIGEIAVITITDPDGNIHPDRIENLNVTVTSDSDPLGQTITATETDVNTGVFTARIQVSSTFETGKVYAKIGDTLYAAYKDKYPADYATTEKSKTFTGTAVVGVPVERPVPASDQKFVDPNTGAEKTEGKVGETIMLQVTVTNVDATNKTFTAIFKVKDLTGATIYIGWASGTLTPGQSFTPAISWTPTAAGTYTIEVLVVKSISEPTPYSDKLSMELVVA